jgi:signal peptidase II
LTQTDSATGSGRTAKVSVRAIATLAFAAVCVWALDQIIKALVVAHLPYGETVDALGSVLQLHYVRNPGAAFSFGVNMTWVFSIVAVAVVVAIIVTARRIRSGWWAIMLGMLLGGALGNLTDRVFRAPGFGQGHVVDFIYTPWMMPAIYNIADSFICISMGLFILLTLLGVNLDGTRAQSKKREEAALATAATEQSNPVTATGGTQQRDSAEPADGATRDQDAAIGHDAT